MKSCNTYAFSLIELLTVIAIIALTAGVGIVSFSSITAHRLATDARKIAADLCWGRQLAASGHQNFVNTGRQNYIVSFDTSAESYALYYSSVGPANLVKTQGLQPGVDLVSVTPSAQITFSYPQGRPAQDTTITLNSQGKTRQVVVFASTGYVRVQ